MTLNRNARLDAALMLAALLLSIGLRLNTGVIAVNDGRGWDGMDYAAMLTSGYDPRFANTALRPFVVVLNMPAYQLLKSPVAAFGAMNLIYGAVLCLAVCRLFARYNPSEVARTLMVLNLFLC